MRHQPCADDRIPIRGAGIVTDRETHLFVIEISAKSQGDAQAVFNTGEFRTVEGIDVTVDHMAADYWGVAEDIETPHREEEVAP
jgi:hypothetical protein